MRSKETGGDLPTMCKYLQLKEFEQGFKELKGDVAVGPIYPSKARQIEDHIFVAFQA